MVALCFGFFSKLMQKAKAKQQFSNYSIFTSRNVPGSTFTRGQRSHLGSVLSKTGQGHFIKVN